MNSANSKSGDHRCASASCAALLALLMVCAPGCGGEDGATSRGAASRSTGNPYLDQLNNNEINFASLSGSSSPGASSTRRSR